jgi:hypothetical protein
MPEDGVTVCVVRDGVLVDVPVTVDPVTGDSLYEGRRFSDAFPADSTFAASAAWYHAYETITIFRRRYIPYGLPRALPPGVLVARGKYRGVTLFAEPGASGAPEVLYLPVRPTCVLQPYETEAGMGIRG